MCASGGGPGSMPLMLTSTTVSPGKGQGSLAQGFTWHRQRGGCHSQSPAEKQAFLWKGNPIERTLGILPPLFHLQQTGRCCAQTSHNPSTAVATQQLPFGTEPWNAPWGRGEGNPSLAKLAHCQIRVGISRADLTGA